ncbi:MAG TPA: hypothetical protein VFR37_06040 [Longimicrobium sp.]|nr:hypothetical protein [Longimicrobium sp.]
MLGSIRWAAALAVAAATLPLTAAAQVQPRPMGAEVPGTRSMAPPRAGSREAVVNWYGELQGISRHLQRVVDTALQRDPALRQARDRFVRTVERAMDSADPELPRLAQRVDRMRVEMEAARRRGDVDRMQALEREGAQITARFMRVQAAVLNQPEIARQARAYEEMLHRRMIQIEPLTESLLTRSGELQRLLQSALGPQQPR